MSDDPWVKFFPSDFLAGVGGLSAAERGVYITLLCQIYEDGGPVERNDQRLARLCGVTKPAFKKALESLIAMRKIREADGYLMSPTLLKWDRWSRTSAVRPAIPLEIKIQVRARDGERCRYCRTTEGPFHLDHVTPWSRGGEHTLENLVVSCASCNLAKGARTLEEWRIDQ